MAKIVKCVPNSNYDKNNLKIKQSDYTVKMHKLSTELTIQTFELINN